MSGLAGKNGADIYFAYSRLVYLFDCGLIHFLVCVNNYLSGLGVFYIFKRHPSKYSLPYFFNYLSAFYQITYSNSLYGAAVKFCNHNVLGGINQPSSQVAGVRCFKRRVRKSLPGAVCGDKILQHG